MQQQRLKIIKKLLYILESFQLNVVRIFDKINF